MVWPHEESFRSRRRIESSSSKCFGQRLEGPRNKPETLSATTSVAIVEETLQLPRYQCRGLYASAAEKRGLAAGPKSVEWSALWQFRRRMERFIIAVEWHRVLHCDSNHRSIPTPPSSCRSSPGRRHTCWDVSLEHDYPFMCTSI